MLTHLDVFLGVALVMLAVSLLLTIATQVVSFALNFRGNQLLKGLTELFDTLKFEGGAALATKILKHDLIRGGLGWDRLAPAISKIDLKHLLEKADTLLGITALDNAKVKEVEDWFDATMSRVASRFTMNTRVVTMICGAVAAFALQLDAFGLVSRLYADSDLRARMAGAAGALVSQSERILATPTTFADAAAALVKKDGAGLTVPTPSPASREQAHAWIRGAVTDAKQVETLTADYDKLLDDALGPAIKSWVGDAKDVQQTLAGAGFRLIPDPYRPWTIWVVLGVLTSACLLSLGAPFWFNTLKALSNLRPAVAATVESRDNPPKQS